MKIPLEIVTGDSVTWLDDATKDNLGNEISSSLWTLVYKLAGPSVLSLTATTYNSGWSTSITSAQSSVLIPGKYYWQATATKALEKITLSAGQLKICQGLANANPGFDGRSQLQKDLDAVQTAMRAIIAGGAVQEYTIANRSLRKMLMSDLILLEKKLKADLVAEEKSQKIKDGLGNPDALYIRFK